MPHVTRPPTHRNQRRASSPVALAIVALALLACQTLSPGPYPTATSWPALPLTLTATASLTAAASAAAPASDVGAFSGTPIALDLPEVTPLPDFTATGEFRWPLAEPGVLRQIYSPNHRGIDIAAPPGTPVMASDSGVVVYAEAAEVYGNLVVIDHGNGYQTWYGHLSAFAVDELAGVAQGQVIGFVGATGASTGPHLHLEIRLDGRPVPPLSHLSNVPPSILDAYVGSERRTATAIAAATQTMAAIFAAQTATARFIAGQTATARYFAEQTQIALSRTPVRAISMTPTVTPSSTLSPSPSPTTATPSATPTASLAPPSATPSLTASPVTPSGTPSATPETPTATPTGDTPTATSTEGES